MVCDYFPLFDHATSCFGSLVYLKKQHGVCLFSNRDLMMPVVTVVQQFIDLTQLHCGRFKQLPDWCSAVTAKTSLNHLCILRLLFSGICLYFAYCCMFIFVLQSQAIDCIHCVIDSLREPLMNKLLCAITKTHSTQLWTTIRFLGITVKSQQMLL